MVKHIGHLAIPFPSLPALQEFRNKLVIIDLSSVVHD